MFVFSLLAERHDIQAKAENTKKALEERINELQEELETTKRQVIATVCGCEVKKGEIDRKIDELERATRKDSIKEHVSMISDKLDE